jgi:NAD(P)-dependent dehydrogenase (short-subunit alcohol dehydrogenase family)
MSTEARPALDGKVAIIYGAGPIGATVASAFAGAGADVHLAGRTQATLDAVANRIRDTGGKVHAATVNALDAASVHDHANQVAAETGHIDICFNLIGHGDVQGIPLIEMDVEDFVRPIDSIVRSTFLTSQATARHMVGDTGGVILFFGGEGEPTRDQPVGGTLVSFFAQEAMRRQLASELAPRGIRVITIITAGIPESFGADATIANGIAEANMLGTAATYDDVGNVAVFAASDKARMMTAATLNISGGFVID